MKNLNKKIKGELSLPEILIAGLIAAVFFAVVLQGFKGSSQSLNDFGAKTATQLQMVLAYQHILRVGRHATNCAKVSGTLECNVDFNVPSNGTTTKVHFIHSVDTAAKKYDILYEVYSGSSWEKKLTYNGITQFDVCNDTDMNTNNCVNIPNTIINTAHAADLTAASPTPANRFYRFRLRHDPDPDHPGKDSILEYRGAFFIRNPTGIGTPNVVYQWHQ